VHNKLSLHNCDILYFFERSVQLVNEQRNNMSSGSGTPPAPRKGGAGEIPNQGISYDGNNNNQWLQDRYQNRRHREDPYDATRMQAGAREIAAESQGSNGLGPQRSVEGWILFVTGLHEEAQEDDISDAFSEYGPVKNVQIDLDRQTGFCKGYALIEYNEKSEAQDAINALHGTQLLGKIVKVDWAFVGAGGNDNTTATSASIEAGSRKKAKRRR